MNTSGKTSVSARACNNVQEFLRKFRELLPPVGQADRFADYGFVINCTNFYESMSENDPAMLFYTLSAYESGAYTIDKDVAFVAYYCFCLYVYRKKDTEMLQSLLNHYVKAKGDKKYFTFEEYPIIWDLVGRICSLRNDFKRLLVCSAAGTKAMPNNVTTWVNYVGAVISWLEADYSKYKSVESHELPKYIEDLLVGDEDFGHGTVIKAIRGAVLAINYNGTYAKYYYHAACLMFYYRHYLRNHKHDALQPPNLSADFADAVAGCKSITVTFDDLLNSNGCALRKQLEELLSTASEHAQSEEERARYKQFADFVDAQFSQTKNVVLAVKNKIINSSRLKDIDGLVKCSTGPHYVIVSYSHENYKSVWCDIVELQSHGVNVVFDESFSSTKTSSRAGWLETFREKLENADGVLCYLSNEYLKSNAVMDELALIESCGKPVLAIDLSGKTNISKIIADIICHGETISSENLKLITSLFSDDKLVFEKPQVDDAIAHFGKLLKRLSVECPKVFTITKVDVQCVQNFGLDGTPIHPNEDSFALDEKNGIFVVADGITRKEGYCSDESVAQIIAEFFCSKMKENLANALFEGVEHIPAVIKDAFDKTNKQVKEFVTKDKRYLQLLAQAKARCPKNIYFESPGCVAAVAVVNNGMLYCGRVGDCGCVLVRNGQRVALTTPQTHFAFNVKGIEGKRRRLYEKYVNQKANSGGYGVINGDENVRDFFDIVSFELCPGDEVYIASDGVANFLNQFPVSYFEKRTVKKLLSVQESLFKKMQLVLDDRTVVKISIIDN